MSLRFKQALRQAYFDEYDTGEIYQFGNRSLQWANKLAFTDKDLRRYVFARGDHVKFTSSGSDQIGRIDQIFTQWRNNACSLYLRPLKFSTIPIQS